MRYKIILFFVFFSILISFACISSAENGDSMPVVSIPGIVTLKASVKEAPPGWAVMQRHLIKTMEEAAPLYLKKVTYRGGTLSQVGKLDDDYESFDEWPLLYIIGGDEKLLDWGLQQFNAITRQCTYERGKTVHNEFAKQYDMLHISEGLLGFQYFGLADPTILENIERARRFAGFYMNEDPEAPNYDPEYKIIRSIATGSKGPADHQGGTYVLNYRHASIYPIVKNLEWDWAENPERREEIQKIYDKVVTPCDIPANLSITGLIATAYIYTGEEKYKKWVEDYVGAWIDRINENNGIIPDNIGRTGKIGEYRNGQWWGGLFGWNSRYSLHIMFIAMITAMESAQLVSGDSYYLDLVRSQVKVLLENSKIVDGQLLIPYRYGPNGWEDYKPMEPYILSHLWHASMDPNDWELIEKLHAGSKYGPPPYEIEAAKSPGRPEPDAELWHPDGSIVDWTRVNNNIEHTCRHHYNEAPHLLFLAGKNPEWPEKILKGEYEHVLRNLERIADPNWEHAWKSHSTHMQNPIFTNGLIQMTMGAPWVSFNGGLLRARVRYFDLDRARPGLPLDVAALVKKKEADRTVVQLVNTSAFEIRNLIVQAGAFGEHEFTEVRFQEQKKDDNGNTILTEKTIPVNEKYFAVELPPATSIKLDIGTKRFVNKPTFAFPWHSEKD